MYYSFAKQHGHPYTESNNHKNNTKEKYRTISLPTVIHFAVWIWRRRRRAGGPDDAGDLSVRRRHQRLRCPFAANSVAMMSAAIPYDREDLHAGTAFGPIIWLFIMITFRLMNS